MKHFLNIEFDQIVAAAKFIGTGSATIGVIGAGVGIGVVFSGYILACSRNPGLSNQLFGFTLLGFALCEAIALFALMMGFLILFV